MHPLYGLVNDVLEGGLIKVYLPFLSSFNISLRSQGLYHIPFNIYPSAAVY